ncbi:MAG: S-adenosylmethionine:tRNA ribosyltransferase-isomerase [Chitinophagaceae bacterium]
MNKIEPLYIEDYDYELPDTKIAKYPLAQRDESKILVVKDKKLIDANYKDIANFLPEHAFLVFNQTKVIPSRLFFKNLHQATIEIFCLSPYNESIDTTISLAQKGKAQWKCLIGKKSKWREDVLTLHIDCVIIYASILKEEHGNIIVEFTWKPPEMTFAEILHIAGNMPIPPYLNRPYEALDKEVYQTIFAKQEGSVAAPTASLHFTETIFETLKSKHIQYDFVSLHVGAGTFLPVKTNNVHEHVMHSEQLIIDLGFIKNITNHIENKRPVFAVGTTSLRTLETLYCIAFRFFNKEIESFEHIEIGQWDIYDSNMNTSPCVVLKYLIQKMETEKQQQIICRTKIMITPNYKPQMVQGIITNFHQPKSTLLLLISSFLGSFWKSVYQYALNNEYRFLSYGDGCLIYLHTS